MTDKATIRDVVRSLGRLKAERKSAEFISELDRVLNIAADQQLWAEGKKAVEEAVAAWNEGLFAIDDMFVVIRHVARFHTQAGEHTAAIELYMVAASRFADFNAFQSAYRLLVDAEEYATEHHLALDLLHVRETGASIALFEGDLAFAEKTFSRLSELRDQMGLSHPPELLVNLGTLQMRKGESAAAASTFKQLLDISSEDPTRGIHEPQCLRARTRTLR